jgi:hypothetical protein
VAAVLEDLLQARLRVLAVLVAAVRLVIILM